MKGKFASTAISTLSTVLVFCLAGVAFVLSFDALRALAESNGVAPKLTALFPISIDGFILAAALAALRANLHGERAWYPSSLVALFTLASVVLNVAHSNGVLAIPRPWLATIVAAVPPTALVLASELLFAQIRSIVRERGAIAALQDVQARHDKLTQDANDLESSINERSKRYRDLGKQIKARQSELAELAQVPQSAHDALVVFYADNPRATHEHAGKQVGLSRQRVGQILKELVEAGRIKKNGSGVRVLEQVELEKEM